VAGGAQVGRVEIPVRKWISKAPLWCHQLTRGVRNNIVDILVKVRGSGVKVRFWTPFWEKCDFFKSTATESFGVAIVLLDSIKYINKVQTIICLSTSVV
jgi:hypothetical protein